MIYIRSIDYNTGEVIKIGPYEPTKIIKVDGKSDQTISKPREYDEEDKRKLSLNVKAKNLLYFALEKKCI